MKNITLLILIFPIVLFAETYKFQDVRGALGVVTKASGTSDYEVSVSFNELSAFNTEDGLKKLSLGDLPLSDDANMAKLPYISFLVESRPGEIEVKSDFGKEYLIEDLELEYSKEMPCRCDDDNKPKALNQEVYENDKRKRIELIYLGDFRGKPLTKVIIYPALYQAREKRLEIIPQFKVSINSQERLLNVEASNNDYLIITPHQFRDVLSRLKSHKEARGYKVTIKDLEEVGNSFDQVKEYIHKYYKNSPFTYALLVGHEDLMPTQYVQTSTDNQTPSDLKYFTFGGEGDYIPDVYYGRLVADDRAEVKRQIDKIIEFETSSYADDRGLRKQIGIASNEGSNPSDVEYLDQMQSPLENSLNLKREIFHQDNKESTPENINKALNQGAFWMNYIGHGSGNSWPSLNRVEYNSDDIKDLRPGKVKPIIIDVACQNGRFTYEGKLGERFLNESKMGSTIGAVAYYGGSVDISWHPPAKMAVEISKIVANKRTKTLGEVLLQGQLELLKIYSNTQEAKENLVWYHLFGDPSLGFNF